MTPPPKKLPTAFEIKDYYSKLAVFHDAAEKAWRNYPNHRWAGSWSPLNDGLAAIEERFGPRAADQLERWIFGLIPGWKEWLESHGEPWPEWRVGKR